MYIYEPVWVFILFIFDPILQKVQDGSLVQIFFKKIPPKQSTTFVGQ